MQDLPLCLCMIFSLWITAKSIPLIVITVHMHVCILMHKNKTGENPNKSWFPRKLPLQKGSWSSVTINILYYLLHNGTSPIILYCWEISNHALGQYKVNEAPYWWAGSIELQGLGGTSTNQFYFWVWPRFNWEADSLTCSLFPLWQSIWSVSTSLIVTTSSHGANTTRAIDIHSHTEYSY